MSRSSTVCDWRTAIDRGAPPRRLTVIAALGAIILSAGTARALHAQSWEGMVVEQGEATYYIEGGRKRLIEDPASAECLGKAPVDADSSLIASLPLGPPKTDCQPAPRPVSLFDYTFAMPGQPALQHIHAAIRMDGSGRIGGSISYENRDYLSPFCGGIVAGVYSADGELLQAFASPVKCVQAKGSGEEDDERSSSLRVKWNTQLRPDLVPRAAILDVRAVSTKGETVISIDQARRALEKRVTVVSEY